MGESAPSGERLYHGGLGGPALKAPAQDLPAHCRVNGILQKYMPETFEDYQRMDEADLKALIGLFQAMRPGN